MEKLILQKKDIDTLRDLLKNILTSRKEYQLKIFAWEKIKKTISLLKESNENDEITLPLSQSNLHSFQSEISKLFNSGWSFLRERKKKNNNNKSKKTKKINWTPLNLNDRW